MSSTEAEVAAQSDEQVVDEGRSSLLEAVSAELGDAVVESHLLAGKDLWIRVTEEAWGPTAEYLHNRQRFRFFEWLSAIDWMPSPFGRSLDAEVDKELAPPEGADPDAGGSGQAETPDDSTEDGAAESELGSGYAGGETRFQVLGRVHSLTTGLGITVKADIGQELSIATWTGEYAGADWHEREVFEMFGITFDGHPGLRNIYLPTGFEGHPLRKDYPLLSRLVKPWPGLVDVELMPQVDDSSDNPESSP